MDLSRVTQLANGAKILMSVRGSRPFSHSRPLHVGRRVVTLPSLKQEGAQLKSAYSGLL